MIDGVVDAFDGVGGHADAAGGEKLERHEAAAPGDADESGGVVAVGGDGAGAVGAVAVVVVGIAVARVGVEAVDVVDHAVVVVVDAVAGDLGGVDPEVGREVGMRKMDTAVDDRDNHARGVVGHGPGGGGVDVGPGHAAGATGVVERPEAPVGDGGFAGRERAGGDNKIGLGPRDGVLGFDEAGEGVVEVVGAPGSERESEQVGAGARIMATHRETERLDARGEGDRVDRFGGAHDHMVGDHGTRNRLVRLGAGSFRGDADQRVFERRAEDRDGFAALVVGARGLGRGDLLIRSEDPCGALQRRGEIAGRGGRRRRRHGDRA